MHRLFVAVELPPDIKETLVRLQNGVPGARWASVDTLHLTVRFIGDVDGPLAEDIGHALSGVASHGFKLSLAGAGVFPLRGPPKVLWAGIAPNDDLRHLKQKIDSALFAVGCPPDPRKFAPHITLAWLKQPAKKRVAEFVAHNGPLIGGDVTVDDFVLFESFLAAAGAIHQVVATYPLARPVAKS